MFTFMFMFMIMIVCLFVFVCVIGGEATSLGMTKHGGILHNRLQIRFGHLKPFIILHFPPFRALNWLHIIDHHSMP